jgi:hypothetical protein
LTDDFRQSRQHSLRRIVSKPLAGSLMHFDWLKRREFITLIRMATRYARAGSLSRLRDLRAGHRMSAMAVLRGVPKPYSGIFG